MTTILIYMAVYILPSYVMFHVGVGTFVRNPRKIEYRLAGLIFLTISMMFLEEFMRQSLPLKYSPFLVTYVFGNLGALSAALVVHFYIHITGWAKRMPRGLYLPLSYLPMVPVILTLLLNRNLFNSGKFNRIGIWVQPDYNTAYYIAIWVGILIIALMAGVTYMAVRNASSTQVKRRFSVVFYGTLFNGAWTIAFGGFAGVIPVLVYYPPYLYIYGLVIWLLVFRWAMFKHNFLPSHEKKYKTLFNLAPTAILIVDDRGKVVETNPHARHLFGYSDVNLFGLVQREDKDNLSNWLDDHFRSNSRVENEEMQFLRQDGSLMAALVDTELVEVEDRELLLVIIRDMTERILSEQKNRKLAYYDSLTELPNRMNFYRLLHEAINNSESTGQRFGVIVLDVDNFKQVNDSYGHVVGDLLLQHIGRGLKAVLPAGDVAARMGGDEFLSIVYRVGTRQYMSEIMEAITNELSASVVVEGHTISVSVSVGFSIYPDDGETQYDLIKNADREMYFDKKK